jgi:hypothetical protein
MVEISTRLLASVVCTSYNIEFLALLASRKNNSTKKCCMLNIERANTEGMSYHRFLIVIIVSFFCS